MDLAEFAPKVVRFCRDNKNYNDITLIAESLAEKAWRNKKVDSIKDKNTQIDEIRNAIIMGIKNKFNSLEPAQQKEVRDLLPDFGIDEILEKKSASGITKRNLDWDTRPLIAAINDNISKIKKLEEEIATLDSATWEESEEYKLCQPEDI